MDVNQDEELELKMQEIAKLEDFGCFEVSSLDNMKDGDKVFDITWVLTPSKARLAMRDLKARSDASTDSIHCPTPSAVANNIFEFKAAYFDMPMVVFDVVSAFPHANETERIFMKPLAEWIGDYVSKLGDKALPRNMVL